MLKVMKMVLGRVATGVVGVRRRVVGVVLHNQRCGRHALKQFGGRRKANSLVALQSDNFSSFRSRPQGWRSEKKRNEEGGEV